MRELSTGMSESEVKVMEDKPRGKFCEDKCLPRAFERFAKEKAIITQTNNRWASP